MDAVCSRHTTEHTGSPAQQYKLLKCCKECGNIKQGYLIAIPTKSTSINSQRSVHQFVGTPIEKFHCVCISTLRTHDLMVAEKLALQDFLYEEPNSTGLGI